MATITEFSDILCKLSEGQTVRNWTKAKGYFGDPFDIVDLQKDFILIKPLSAVQQKISQEDFDKVICY
jgi:RNA binding exosome subunit